MPKTSNRPPRNAASPASTRTPDPFMWITPGRVIYVGLLGRPTVRRIGAWAIYFSLDAPLRVSIDSEAGTSAGWVEGSLALVPPYVRHRIACDGPQLPDVLVEPESVQADALAPWFGGLVRDGGVADLRQPGAAELLPRLRSACEQLRPRVHKLPADDAAFDRAVFGRPFPSPQRDPRIGLALKRLQADLDTSAERLASVAEVSFSRFLHLFREEVGVPLRTYRSWKRARRVLSFVTDDTNLTAIAQDVGYPDSAHFSRSIRKVFGLQPRDVMAGCRRLVLRAAPSDDADS